MVKARPGIKIPEPRISRFIVFLVKIFARLYLFLFLGVARVLLRGGDYLFDAYKRALRGDSRCILAFRHPNGGEPQLLAWFIIFRLRQLARKAGVSFARRPHICFVYGYEVVRWGGFVARLVMPRLGAMPVHHAKLDSVGMARIYKAILDGPYPLAIAPEGQVSYTAETVPRLEQGTVRIGFQAADKLRKAGKSCPVEVLPVSIHFRYGMWARVSLERLLRRIEKYTGTGMKGKAGGTLPFTERLRQCRDLILAHNEKRYGLVPDENHSFEERINAVMELALDSAEKILRIGRGGDGDIIGRLYHIRQICWDRIYVPEMEEPHRLPRVERSLADLRAGEAWYASRHMELVDFVWYFRVPIPPEDAPLHLKIEYIQNLWDFANRTMGGAYTKRVINPHPRRVIIQVAPPLNLSERLPEYHRDKKNAIASAMDTLRDAYLDCIEDVKSRDKKGHGGRVIFS
jgi:1-acyl-sn-glycerol-3-phosphate acyltransferase